MNWLILLGMIVVAAVMVGYALFPRKNEEYSELARRRSAGLSGFEDPDAAKKIAPRTLQAKLFEIAAPLLSRPVMPKNAAEQSTLKAKLASAGFRRDSAAIIFLASKTAVAVPLGILAGLYAANADKPWTALAGYAVFGAGIGFMLPNLWLNIASGKRVERIRNGLADALDLMVVAVEAGLGLDAALQRVSDEMSNVHPTLAEELQIATVETQMGVPRSEALTKMADRTAVPEMRALVAVITQAEKLGTSIAKALRTQAESLRTKRRQKAEERAQKTAVKLLLPLILFIFPTIFVVLAGPAAIQLMKTFSEGLIK